MSDSLSGLSDWTAQQSWANLPVVSAASIPFIEPSPEVTPAENTPYPGTNPFTFPNSGYQNTSNEGIITWDKPGGTYVPVDFQNLDWNAISKIPTSQSVSTTVATAIQQARAVPAGINTEDLNQHPKLSDFNGKAATTGDLFGSFNFLGLTGITAFIVFWMLMQKK